MQMGAMQAQASPSLGTVIEREIVQPAVVIQAVPVSADSKPFLTSKTNLAAQGYVEEEFFLSGNARTYDWAGDTLNIRAITEPGPYTTRILVRRPADPQRFSGNIEVEPLNASLGADISMTMTTSPEYVLRQGDVWIGITSKPLAVRALKHFDPARYATLDWSNPAPVASRCEHPSIVPEYSYGWLRHLIRILPPASFPESEDGLIWDMYAQLGALLKSDQRNQILPGFSSPGSAQPRLFSTGTSQSGLLQRTFINGFHGVMRLPDGGPIFDGYLTEVGPGMLRINQCAPDTLPDDPRNRIKVPDVPVINIVSEGDMWLGLHTRAPDAIAPHVGLVTYEIAGATHDPGMGTIGLPSAEEMAKAGVKVPSLQLPRWLGGAPNDFPRGFLTTAALRNLQVWARDGAIPPQGQPLLTDADGIVRDADGNARGGVRSPWIDVPTASYQGAKGTGPLAVVGSKNPFSAEELKQRYPTHADYLARVKARVDQLVAGRWLLPEDVAPIMARADAESVPDGAP